MHFIAYSSLWFPFLLHLDWHKLCNMVVLISAPGGQAAGWRGWEMARAVWGQSQLQKLKCVHPKWSMCVRTCICACVCVCVCVDLHPRAAEHAFNKAFRRSCRHKCLPKVLTSLHRHFHCWYKYHTHTHTHTRAHTHASATVQVTQSLLSSILSIGCHLPHVLSPNQSEPTSLMTERIFLHQALVVERPPVKKKNCVRLGVGSYWVAVHAHVCGLKLDRSKKPVLICPKECSWRGANSQWLQLVVAERERDRERKRENTQFYLGGCGKVPSSFTLTGHLSNWSDATVQSLLCHVAWLELPRCISHWKNRFEHFDSLRVTWLRRNTLWGPARMCKCNEFRDLITSTATDLLMWWCDCLWNLKRKP